MKEIVLKVYKFDELSKDAQEQIIERERWNIMEQCMDCYNTDYVELMKAFEDLTDTKVYDYEVGYSRYDFDFGFKYHDAIYKDPDDYNKDIYPENLCGKLLFRYINNNIMTRITKGKYYFKGNKYRHSRVILEYDDNCPLTGTCYDLYILKPIIYYYETWCTYPDDFSLEDLIGQCYDSFFKAWHEEYEYWADDENAIREELHNSRYEDQLYYENGDVYVGPLNEIE